jgi:hypothetical protein
VDYALKHFNIEITNLLYQKNEIYLSLDTLTSFDSIFNPFSYSYIKPIIKVSNILKHDQVRSSTYASIFLRSDYDYSQYTRTFKSFMDLLSQIGGIWKVIFMVGGLIMIPLNFKLLTVAISNDLFNMISPDKNNIEKENYSHFKSLKNSSKTAEKIIEIWGKDRLESEIAIKYFKYERNKGLNFTLKEAICNYFLFCCKSKSIEAKEKLFKVCEEKIIKRLNISAVLNFSKQVNSFKRALLHDKEIMISFSNKNAIQYEKLNTLKKKYLHYLDVNELEPVDLALLKEKYFISGMRYLKNKITGLDEKIDLNLLEMFNINKEILSSYLINHKDQIANMKEPNLIRNKN